MIGRLRGIILEKQPPLVLLETAGVGYEVHMPMTCFYELPEAGQEAIVFTHFVVREDAQLLYGFNNKQERTLFKELIKTNGVGPKLALAILSGMSAQQFVNAVEREEVASLVKLPGIGKKTAERLIVEMKDRFKAGKAHACLQSAQQIHSAHGRPHCLRLSDRQVLPGSRLLLPLLLGAGCGKRLPEHRLLLHFHRGISLSQ